MSTLRIVATAAAGLLGVAYASGCTPETPSEQDGTNDTDGADGTADDGPVGPPECPDNPDPECTTDAACGNNEVCSGCACVELPSDCMNPEAPQCVTDAECTSPGTCVACVCLFACADMPDAECTTDNDCFGGGTCSEADGCVCTGGTPCSDPDDECATDADCGGGPCNPETCSCEIPCECGPTVEATCETGEVCDGCDCMPAPGEADPTDDCADDFAAVECDPSIDIVATEISCTDGEITVAVTYAETPIEAMPEILTQRGLTFWDDADEAALGFFARAEHHARDVDVTHIVAGRGRGGGPREEAERRLISVVPKRQAA
ncbi:MAG: hypothetical protein AAF721_01400, partial [Myxococcota bacterium]